MIISEFLNSFDDTKLYVRKSFVNTAKAVLIIAHGLTEHCNRYEHLIKNLNMDGFNTYLFDHRGHGKSDGERGHCNNFYEIVKDINFMVDIAKKENENLPIFLLGHDLGGLAIAEFAINFPHKANGLIMSSALTNNISNTYITNDVNNLICSDKSVVNNYIKDSLIVKEISDNLYIEIKNTLKSLNEHINKFEFPVLILHGKEDKLILCDDSTNFYNKISSSDKTLKIYDGLYHEILNEPDRDYIIDDISQWIKSRL
ncbi:alpha/beta hydrolase [Clostridium botulinum]|uniref:Alpha/beta hydrolase n=1 Tax=Clostridium botulinum TaxID=1491 RepID=A0A6B4S0L2_CLOBO|nr:alpha/beta fold hydrolase [Clostridium botulinum]EES48684.1 lysophospholipase [Clostridium botulinum E1 str. 'BoNT E Beluga']MBY6759914.1 alpha/beta hydrolase [Clostridium botulinum]MBY6918824.1 alpha/beta hydrolase [Clostridium botulinum]MCR1129910.1 lysophospholipase [Clostridium botulinum]NFH91119.1 alpha/beta hydrolase [Clostridium botulinum]